MRTSDTVQDPALDELLCFSIYSADNAFGQLYRKLLDSLDLTYLQYLVLKLLWARDGRTVGELGSSLRLQSNTLTPLLKRMETLSLIDRRRDSQDERIVRISLTAQGRALEDRAADIPGCIADATGMTADELGQAIELIGRLRDSVLAAAKAPEDGA